jgi:2-C-methyl-D-erythritol 4-phosphate cytidylyltransferase
MRYWLVMPAAGSGSRFGADGPKQYVPLAGRTVIEWALAPFLADARCAHIVVALAVGDASWARVAAQLGAAVTTTITTVTGGEQRSRSVRLALAALETRAAAEDWVLVHDAARPCLARTDLERLIGGLASHRVGGLLATPATDTLKRTQQREGTQVLQTVERAGLWRALTPQMFRYQQLCMALDRAHAEGRFPSDEAQALEWLGEQPALIAGAAGNLKITTAEDLVLAAAVLGARSREEGA